MLSMNDLDRELARSVQIDPSPDLAARVRARIASEPAASRWSVPTFAIATISAIAVGIAVSNLAVLNRNSRPLGEPIGFEYRNFIVMAPLRASVSEMRRIEPSSPTPRVIISKAEMMALQQLFAGGVVAPPESTMADELSIPELAIEPVRIPVISEGDKQ
jgi:hypothetical protein